MGIIATAVEHLIAAGIGGADLVKAIADMEAAALQAATPAKSDAAEKRRAYDRERKRLLNEDGFLIARQFVFERDNWTCQYCGERPEVPHADHVIPLSRGGRSTADNLITSCGPCNLSKGAKTLGEWTR